MIQSKNNTPVFFSLAVFSGLLLLSCATKSDAWKDIDNAVYRNQFGRGIEAMQTGQDKTIPIYRQNNAVSLFLDKGLLEHYAGNYQNSSSDLQQAERLIEEAFTKSVTAELASYIANDNTKEYPGEDFEGIYLNIFNALNYYNNSDIEGALVEIRKLTWSNGKLDLLNRKYENTDTNVAGDSMAQLLTIGFTGTPEFPQKTSVQFSDSALARYLGALFFLAEGNTDSARIEFAHIQAAFASNPNVYSHPFPQAVEGAQSVPDGKARLNIIAFTGLSPIKEEGVFNQIFPFFQNKVLWYPQFKLPVLVKRPSRINRVEVVIGYSKFNLELFEDMGAVIEETYNARFSRIFLKTYIRTMLRYAAIDVAAAEARKRAETDIQAILAVTSALAAKGVFDAADRADIRMSRYLPDKAYIGGINLDPGNHDVEILFYEGNRLIAAEQRNVIVRENGLNLIEAISLN